jgi:hypothetical protein
MFKQAVRDSLVFFKKHYLIFSVIVLFQILGRYFNLNMRFKEMSAEDFLSIKGAFFFGVLSIYILIIAGLYSAFSLFKQHKLITTHAFLHEYKKAILPMLTYAIEMSLVIILIAALISLLIHIEIIGNIEIYKIYNYFVQENSFILFITSAYFFFYIVLKLNFWLVFTFINKDKLAIKSFKKSFLEISYKKIIRVIIAFISYAVVVISIGKFFYNIIELFIAEQAVAYLKLGEFNFYGFIYEYIRGSVSTILILFLASYGWQFHHKLNEK